MSHPTNEEIREAMDFGGQAHEGVEEVSHTPGPWVQSEANPHRILASFLGGYYHAEVAYVANGQASTSFSVEMGDANARLISAAPDLLEAVRATMRALLEMEDMGSVRRMEWFETDGIDLYDLLREVIEKAEGAQP